MTKYEHNYIENPIDYGAKRYYDQGYYGPNVWFKGTEYDSDFTMCIVRTEWDQVMEEAAHTHDFDMYLWLLPTDPNDMANLGCEVEFFLGEGEDRERIVATKTCSFYIPKGMVHGPLTFRNVTKPLYLVHGSIAPNYKTWRTGKPE
jgi:hypothetical protein